MKKASHMVAIFMWAFNTWTTKGIRVEKKLKIWIFRWILKKRQAVSQTGHRITLLINY